MRQLKGESMTSGINVYSPWITVTIGDVSVDRTLCQTLVSGEKPKLATHNSIFDFRS